MILINNILLQKYYINLPNRKHNIERCWAALNNYYLFIERKGVDNDKYEIDFHTGLILRALLCRVKADSFQKEYWWGEFQKLPGWLENA